MASEYPQRCVEWPGGKDRHGYPRVRIGSGRSRSLASVMLSLFIGAPPAEGLHVLHSCDNPACINPAHLRWGTAKQNAADKVRRNRHPRGALSSHSKLTEEAVIEIRSGRLSLADAAAKYGIKKSSYYRARLGDAWAHVQERRS